MFLNQSRWVLSVFFVCVHLFSQAALPDSISRQLNSLSNKPLRDFQETLITRLQDSTIAVETKESIAIELIRKGELLQDAKRKPSYFFTSGLIFQRCIDNGAMALYAYDKSFIANEALNDRAGMAASLWQSMSTLADLQLYEEALRYLFKVESILQQYNYQGFGALASKMLDMGALFFQTGNYEVAIQYYEKAFTFRDIETDKAVMMHAFNTLGLAYQRIASYPEALKNFQQSHALANQIGDRFWSALTYGNMGAVYFEQSSYENALGHLLYDLKVSQELGVWNSAANSATFIARIYRRQKKLDIAKSYLDMALEMDAKATAWRTRNNIYEQYSKLFAELGDYKQAYQFELAHELLSDSMQASQQDKEQLLLARKHRFELQDQAKSAAVQIETYESKLSEYGRLLAVMTVVLLLMGLGLAFSFRRHSSLLNQFKQQQRAEIQRKELNLLRKQLLLYVHLLKQLPSSDTNRQKLLPDAGFWELFRHKFDEVFPHFFSKTKSNFPELSHQDILLIALLKLKMETSPMQLLFDLTDTAWQEWKQATERKLGIQAGKDLEKIVESL